MTFKEFAEEKGIEFSTWQIEAAEALLAVMHEHRAGATGKTFLMKELSEFVSEYGNTFEV